MAVPVEFLPAFSGAAAADNLSQMACRKRTVMGWLREGSFRHFSHPNLNVSLPGLGWSNALVLLALHETRRATHFRAYLPILLLIAGQLAHEEEIGSRRWLLWSSAVIRGTGVAISAVLSAGLWNSRHLAFVPDADEPCKLKPDLQAETLRRAICLI